MSAPSWSDARVLAPAPIRSTATRRWVGELVVAVAAAGGVSAACLAAGVASSSVLAGMQVVLLGVGVWLGVVDARERRLPDRILAPTAIAVVAVLGVVDLFAPVAPPRVVMGVLGAAFCGVVLFCIAMLGTAGLGDVKLAALLGLVVLPLYGFGAVLVAVASAYVLALPHALCLVVDRRGGGERRDVPFGPYLLGGALVAVLWSLWRQSGA